MTACLDCKAPMSTDAPACPRCGRLAYGQSWQHKLLAAVLLVGAGLGTAYYFVRFF